MFDGQALVIGVARWGYDVRLGPLPLGFAGMICKTDVDTLIDLGITRERLEQSWTQSHAYLAH